MNRATLRINKFSAQGITREKRKSHETSLSSTSVWRGVKCERMFGWRLDNKIHDEVNERHPEGETDKEQKKRLSQGNSIKKNEAWKEGRVTTMYENILCKKQKSFCWFSRWRNVLRRPKKLNFRERDSSERTNKVFVTVSPLFFRLLILEPESILFLSLLLCKS